MTTSNSSSPRTLAIVGAGPAGLATCHYALKEGLFPTVFEASESVGGVWNSTAWNGMRTNISKWACVFSDAPHLPDASISAFPTAEQMQEYLIRYCDVHGLWPYIKLHARVQDVRKEESEGTETKWAVTWCDTQEVNSTTEASFSSTSPPNSNTTTTQAFDTAAFCTGMFGTPFFPTLDMQELAWKCYRQNTHNNHKGQDDKEEHAGVCSTPTSMMISHTRWFNIDHYHAGERVLVVGAAFSGADISVALAKKGCAVTTAMRTPQYIIPRELNGLPRDIILSRRTEEDMARTEAHTQWLEGGKSSPPPQRDYLEAHEKLTSLMKDAWESEPSLRVDLTEEEKRKVSPMVTISDEFVEYVAFKKEIRLIRSPVSHVEIRVSSSLSKVETQEPPAGSMKERKQGCVNNTNQKDDGAKVEVHFENGRKEFFDRVLFATGYTTALGYFDADTLHALKHDALDFVQPVILHVSTLHPSLPNAGFVGMCRGSLLPVMELQARWLTKLLSRQIPWPTQDTMSRGLMESEGIRSQVPRPPFANGSFIQYCDKIATQCKVSVSDAFRQYEEEGLSVRELKERLKNQPPLPQDYLLVEKETRGEAIEEMDRIMSAISNLVQEKGNLPVK